MTLSARARLGPYQITAKLGEGGMGEVYRAHDARLDREVAIKILPAAFIADPERLARFEREAKLLAQLHHPNIASIFGLEESAGARALVMELVEGPTLADRLAHGSLPLDESLAIARQIAEALEEAHAKGIVHRDLKPANVKVRDDGTVKVLDFGLAKALDPSDGAGPAGDPRTSPTLMNSPTLSLPPGTQLGVILGTAAYMAPEQARGSAVDKRADIWSFGVVLFEMLTGHQLFVAETVPDTLAAVLTREIDWQRLPAATPVALRDLLRRCLERKPKSRLHDIADARLVLDELLASPGSGVAATPAPGGAGLAARGGWPTRLTWLAAGLVLGALAVVGLGVTVGRPQAARPPVVRALTYSGTSRNASISPDGRFVAFSSNRDGTWRIWLKQLATGEEVALTAGADVGPRISPDSSTVLFGRLAGSSQDLYRVPLVGGEPRRLVREAGPADWSPDGRQIAVTRNLGPRSQLLVLPADGGEEKLLVESDDMFRDLAWSPDGKRLLVVTKPRVNQLSATKLLFVDAATGARHELYQPPGGSMFSAARWDGNDAVLFAWSPSQAGRGEALLERLTLGTATPRPVFSFTSLPSRIELAGRGALLFDNAGRHQNLFELGAGTRLGRALTGGPTLDRQPAFSPDGQRVVFTSDRSGSLDLWSLELANGAVRRLTFDAADDWDPQWSPDGKHLLWSSNRGGHFEVWMAEPDGTGARQVTTDGVDAENPTMSADGAWIVYASGNPANRGVWKIRPDGGGAALVLAGNYAMPEIAPRSGWVVATQRTGTFDAPIHVVRLDDGAPIAVLRTRSRQVNPGRARWAPDGRTLIFASADATEETALYEQPVVPGRDTENERRLVATGDERRVIETFGVSPRDGRLVISAGWTEGDILLAEGIPGIGASLPERQP